MPSTSILTLETNKYKVKLENFEGPLDLLCHLIDKNKMDIYDINLSEITDQYIEYINEMEKMNLEVTSEFLVMASTLLYLKSKNLLPNQVEDEKELTEEELLQRIIEYKKYKEITKKLREMYQNSSAVIFKLPEVIELPKQKLEREYKKDIISDTYAEIVEKNASRLNENAKNIEKIAITETFTVGDKVKTMFKALLHSKTFVFNKLFSNKQCSNKEIVTAFTGLLELSRRSKVLTSQEELFGDITVEKKHKNMGAWDFQLFMFKIGKIGKTNIKITFKLDRRLWWY